MSKLIQCVPNFSEGRRRDVVEAIVDSIETSSRARVVDYSMDVDHNRAVVTIIGEPHDIRKSAYAGAKTAVELIDLNKHEGGHPRVGAVDVIPFTPLREVTMEEAIVLSHDLGKDIADNLAVPVYFYEQSAATSQRSNLADIRKGGFEALKKNGLVGNRKPDLGPTTIHPTAGAVVIGARGPLIAFNVNLATNDMSVAKSIAAKIRSIRGSGEALEGVKAIAVYLKSRDTAQVSTNITLPHSTSMYDVYAFVERQARAMGVDVLESELIGAIRVDALIDSAQSSMKLPGLSKNRVLE